MSGLGPTQQPSRFSAQGRSPPKKRAQAAGANITDCAWSISVDPDPLKKALVLERNTVNCPAEIITLYFVQYFGPLLLSFFFLPSTLCN